MIKMRLSSPALADRGARLAGVGFTERLVPRQVGAVDYEFPTACPPPHADRAAPDAPPPASGAVPFDSCPALPAAGRDSAPAVIPPSAGAVVLSEASAFILQLIAAHEGRPERDVLAALIAAAGHAIGLSALVFRGAEDIEDIADLPGYARKAANRFRGGGP